MSQYHGSLSPEAGVQENPHELVTPSSASQRQGQSIEACKRWGANRETVQLSKHRNKIREFKFSTTRIFLQNATPLSHFQEISPPPFETKSLNLVQSGLELIILSQPSKCWD